MEETSKKHRAEIEHWAIEAYGSHRMTKVEPKVWLCERPGDSCYHFYVAMPPHAIIVYGDIGDMIIRPGWNREIGWLRGALHDGKGEYFDYLLGKVPGPNQRKEFFPGDVISQLISDVEDEPDYLESYQMVLEEWGELYYPYGGDPQQTWIDAASNQEFDCEFYTGFEDYDSEMYWCAHALKWFIKEWVRQNGETEGHQDRSGDIREVQGG